MKPQNKKNSPNRLELSVETRELRAGIRAATQMIYADTGKPVGGFTCGVYAFFDYDGEPIYVGQTYEGLSSRIGRHLTNQRTDAVAMSVLDPFEVCWIEFYPLVKYDKKKGIEAKIAVTALELSVYRKLVSESQFGAILNEKSPAVVGDANELPLVLRVKIVTDNVLAIRGHSDVRLARRAQTISRLAQIIAERQVSVGLRLTLLTQARRLTHLAGQQFSSWGGDNAVEDKSIEEIDD